MRKRSFNLLNQIQRWINKTPIAWYQLTYRKVRFFTASLGVASAIILMFIQLGLLGALEESNTVLHKRLRGELVMLNTQSESLVLLKNFSRRYLYQALGFAEVDSISPMYFGQRSFKNLNLDQSILGSTRPISIFGINPQRSPFDFPSIDVQLDKIQNPNVFLFDRQSRPEYGTLSDDFAAGIANVELEGQRITIGGIVDFIGASFGITGNLVTSDVNFLELFPEQNAERIALGIITLKDKTETDRIAQLLESRLPEDIMVLTIPQFVELDKYYWQKTTIVGFVFQMGATIGFLIGLYTVYQILYTEISDAIPDYAILKASGYQNTFFWGLLFQEALILSCSSYIPGYLISIFLYQLFNQGTNVALTMNSGRAFLVLILTFCMCLFSGFLVSKKLKESDPADLF